MANDLISSSVYQTIIASYPSEKADDNVIRLTFALVTENGVATYVSNGGVWKGLECIGSFDGLIGFAHDVQGEDKEAVDALLSDLSSLLSEHYGVPEVGNEPEEVIVEEQNIEAE